MNINKPILYSFRRCPYAIRARMALIYAGIDIEIREVDLKNKPVELLAISPKGTVPVLKLPDSQILEESLAIMQWALQQQDLDFWWPESTVTQQAIKELMRENDFGFKPLLDRYKYAPRFPELSKEEHRKLAEFFVIDLEKRLNQHTFLFGPTISLADVAIFPFLRQFAAIESGWFQDSPYNKTKDFLSYFHHSSHFLTAMKKEHS